MQPSLTVLPFIILCTLVICAEDTPKPEPKVAKQKEQFDAELPPRVVKVEPAYAEKNVAFTLQEVKVTFDRPMQTEKAWSWMMCTEAGVYPGIRGGPEPRWENEDRTCVLAVKLSPDTVYALGVNSPRNTGFKDKEGKVALPYYWVFKTKTAVPDQSKKPTERGAKSEREF